MAFDWKEFLRPSRAKIILFWALLSIIGAFYLSLAAPAPFELILLMALAMPIICALMILYGVFVIFSAPSYAPLALLEIIALLALCAFSYALACALISVHARLFGKKKGKGK